MNFVIESNFKELNFSEILSINGGGYWTGFGAAVIGGAGLGVSFGQFGGPVAAAGGGILGGVIGGVLYVI